MNTYPRTLSLAPRCPGCAPLPQPEAGTLQRTALGLQEVFCLLMLRGPERSEHLAALTL